MWWCIAVWVAVCEQGFLMRRAFELAFATAYVFLGKLPMFLEVCV